MKAEAQIGVENNLKRIAFVVPRYGVDTVGGAENLARGIAEEIASKGHETEVLTTCAVDHFTWKNHFPAGEETINGVFVRRFKAESRVSLRRAARIRNRIENNRKLSVRQEIANMKYTLYSQDLFDFIDRNVDNYKAMIFLPYLFSTTYFGMKSARGKGYLIPCLHDEPFARMKTLADMIKGARGCMFNTLPEMELAERLYGRGSNWSVVGLGFRKEFSSAALFRERYQIEGPFMLYMGRREAGKNIPLLLKYFTKYIEENSKEIKLVMTGSGHSHYPLAYNDRIVDLGFIPSKARWDAYAAADIICQPSVNESLSILLLEGWLTGAPCIVHSDCSVTRYHVEESGGGRHFRNYESFREALDLMLDDGSRRIAMGRRGKEYVEKVYSWGSVVERFLNAIE